MLNLDTHILIHALTDQLEPQELKVLRSDEWSISAIVTWELAKLAQLGRIQYDLNSPELVRVLGSIHVWPVTLDVCRAIPLLDFKSDPADEIIAATSILHRVPLVTRDRKLRGSRIVPLAALK